MWRVLKDVNLKYWEICKNELLPNTKTNMCNLHAADTRYRHGICACIPVKEEVDGHGAEVPDGMSV